MDDETAEAARQPGPLMLAQMAPLVYAFTEVPLPTGETGVRMHIESVNGSFCFDFDAQAMTRFCERGMEEAKKAKGRIQIAPAGALNGGLVDPLRQQSILPIR